MNDFTPDDALALLAAGLLVVGLATLIRAGLGRLIAWFEGPDGTEEET